jgi:SAM-dependent methyltransferase
MVANKKDFRTELYNRYQSTFKKFIDIDKTESTKSVFEIWRRRYLPHLTYFPKEETSIPDIGCCSGLLFKFPTLEVFDSVYSIDISNEQIEKARAKGTIFNPNSFFLKFRIAGFDNLLFYGTGLVPKNSVGIIRIILWEIVKIIAISTRSIETGGKEDIITQNFICSARKV